MIVLDLDTLSFSEEVNGILESIDDMAPLLKALGNAAHGLWNEKFRRSGPGWEPLSEVTLKKRRKKGKDAEILKDDGILFASLTDSASEAAIFELDSTELRIGTNREFAEVHQFGSRDGRIPARPFMLEESEAVPEFERVITKYYERLDR